MPTNPCGLPTDHPDTGGGTYNYDPNVDIVREVDPYTGTFKSWKSYAIDAKNLDMLYVNQLRYLLTTRNTGLPWEKVLEVKRNMKEWEKVWMANAFPYNLRTCGAIITPDTLPVKGWNMHENFDAFPPVGFNLTWVPEGFWRHYDMSWPRLKDW